MGSTELSVCWSDHHGSQAAIFRSFLDTNHLVDCTIAAEGEYLQAHKLVLSACSSYFQMLFTQEKERNPIVILKDIKYEELQAIIEFVYCGEVKIPEERLAVFLEAAQSLQIKGLESIAKCNKNPNTDVNTASHSYTSNREEISTNSNKHFHISNSNVSEESACEFVQVTCASNFRNSHENPAQVQLCHIANSATLLSSQPSPTNENKHALGAQSDATNILALPAPVTNVSRPNFHSSEDLPPGGGLPIETEPSESMFLEPKAEDIHSDSEGNMSVMNDVNEMMEDQTPVPYQVNQYCDPLLETVPSEAMFLEPKTEDTHDASEGNMSEMNDTLQMEDDVASAPYEESRYSAATSEGVLTGCLRREESTAVFGSCPSDNTIDIAKENATQTLSRQHNSQVECKRDQDESAEPKVANIVSYSLRGPEGKSHVCPECRHAFGTAHALRRHTRSQHRAVRPYRCDLCNTAFQFPSRLKIHMRKHTGERPYLCEVCNAAFSLRSRLTAHMRIHTGERPYRCEVCSATFTHGSTLNTHMRKHTGERPYRCEVCSAAFSFRCVLNNHMRQHTGERPYRCEVCGVTFAHYFHLTSHMRRHTGEKPFLCGDCGKRFVTKYEILVHTRTHTGEKPYLCGKCGKHFTRQRGLVRHMCTHTEKSSCT